jgi:hypothetical protein
MPVTRHLGSGNCRSIRFRQFLYPVYSYSENRWNEHAIAQVALRVTRPVYRRALIFLLRLHAFTRARARTHTLDHSFAYVTIVLHRLRTVHGDERHSDFICIIMQTKRYKKAGNLPVTPFPVSAVHIC